MADVSNETIDMLISRISALEKTVQEGFKTMDERLTSLELILTGIGTRFNNMESRMIDIEQRQIAHEIQIESRFYSIEVLLEKNTEPNPAWNKHPGKTPPKGRGKV
ncbi:hypothetical protein [Chitinophaga pinensis]|uniref:Uncharacterized protein n=1 Tax=Chitinophaga pinensis (strain ATCC 43595 / DSM 2588 / LMG 13176 / NBRC 15968 / NCIMB 11800 / UQM 2034) TaxID=485918 RepID=A0A979GW61_CHIPD|nr:hypothetical protein [Chitinophaga pinensis]ACU61566.1 hypothetical protein Cpin_4106 [Chitinophaga pinensis DSM 2588]